MKETKELPPLALARSYLDSGEDFEIIPGKPPEYPPAQLYARFADDRTIPFHGHEHTERVELQTVNREMAGEVIGTGWARIYFGGEVVYGFQFGEIRDALERARQALKWLREWPVITNWSGEGVRRELINRAIWYREMPGVITQFIGERGEVTIVPDQNIDWENFPYEPWRPEGFDQRLVKVAVDIMSPHIHWYRREA